MYVPILWLETCETSVLNIKDTKTTKEKGIKRRWGSSWYPAIILQKSRIYLDIIFIFI